MKHNDSKLQEKNPQYKNDPRLASMLNVFEDSCIQMIAAIRVFRKMNNIPERDYMKEKNNA